MSPSFKGKMKSSSSFEDDSPSLRQGGWEGSISAESDTEQAKWAQIIFKRK